MRNRGALDALFPSIRARVLSATLLQPKRWWFLTELAAHLGVTPSSLQREMELLAQAEILLHRKDGRRTYYKANPESPLYPELRGLMEKTTGIVPALKDLVNEFDEQIEIALLYGSVARGSERAESDIDLMLVGTLRQIDLVPALRKLERRFQREVNVTLFSPEEFHRKRRLKDHFLSTVLEGKITLLKGTVHELEEASSGT